MAASGIPPPWIDTVAAAEAWALLQAARLADPGTVFKTDCLSVLRAIRSGRARATAPDRPLARVMQLIFGYFDDPSSTADIVWLPGHAVVADIGRAALSDGSLLSRCDYLMNSKADALAKQAARECRVAPQARAAHVARWVLTQRFARHIGRATYAANHADGPPCRDSEPVPRRERQAVPRPTGDVRPPRLGGHVPVPREDGGWGCYICWKRSAAPGRLAGERCDGDVFNRWAARDARLAAAGRADAATHSLQMVGSIVWCTVCGAYSSQRAVGIAAECRGRPLRTGEWGRHTKLARLRRGLHPKTGQPVDVRSWKRPPELLRDADALVQGDLTDRLRAEVGLQSLSRHDVANVGLTIASPPPARSPPMEPWRAWTTFARGSATRPPAIPRSTSPHRRGSKLASPLRLGAAWMRLEPASALMDLTMITPTSWMNASRDLTTGTPAPWRWRGNWFRA